MLKQFPVSYGVQLRFTNALHRSVLLVDAVMWICLVSRNETCSSFAGPKVNYYGSCWNQLVYVTVTIDHP